MQTKSNKFGILVVFGLLTLVASNVSAQSLKATFDEWGNGTDGSGAPLTAYLSAVEPISGLSTLMYVLPWTVTPGDLIINDSAGVFTDLIRFDTNTTYGGVAYFFSDGADESPSPPADSPVIPPYIAAFPPVTEIGSEGSNFASYFASGPFPGSVTPGGLGVAYTIISDSPAVPEPSTFMLLGLGAFSLAAYAWRKRK
jgi:hypothetical protein